MSLRPSDEKKRKPNFFSCAVSRWCLEAEHLAQVVGADLDRRFADLVRGDGHRMDAPLEDEDVEVGERLLQLERERQAGEAAAGDDDVVAADEGSRRRQRARVDRGVGHDGCPAAAVSGDLATSTSASERVRGSAIEPASMPALGRRDGFEQRQRAGHRIAGEASRRRRADRRGAGRRAHERPVERRHRALARARREHDRAGEQAGAVGHRRERAGRLDIDGDQQHRSRVGQALASPPRAGRRRSSHRRR